MRYFWTFKKTPKTTKPKSPSQPEMHYISHHFLAGEKKPELWINTNEAQTLRQRISRANENTSSQLQHPNLIIKSSFNSKLNPFVKQKPTCISSRFFRFQKNSCKAKISVDEFKWSSMKKAIQPFGVTYSYIFHIHMFFVSPFFFSTYTSGSCRRFPLET